MKYILSLFKRKREPKHYQVWLDVLDVHIYNTTFDKTGWRH